MRFAFSTVAVALLAGILCASSAAQAQDSAAADTADSGAAAASTDAAASDDGFVADGYVGDSIVNLNAAGCIGRWYGHNDLFYNYYTHGACNAVNAQMYISPLPVPPYVGHTFFTYQPFYPHHMLYHHHDRFHHHYDYGRGLNRTHVSYRPKATQLARDFYYNWIRLPR